MVNMIILFLLIFGFLMGLKRGFILQAFHLIGFIIAFIVAAFYYDLIAEKLSLWIPYPELSDGSTWSDFLQSSSMQNAFYNAIAFAIIFFSVKIRSEEHTSELQSRGHLVCRLLLEKKK